MWATAVRKVSLKARADGGRRISKRPSLALHSRVAASNRISAYQSRVMEGSAASAPPKGAARYRHRADLGGRSTSYRRAPEAQPKRSFTACSGGTSPERK